MDSGDRLYTKEADGTIQKWYVQAWVGPMFSVSTIKNAKLKDFRKYYHMDDLGKTIFFTRREAKNV